MKITILYNTIDPQKETNHEMLPEAGAVEEVTLLAKTLTDCGFDVDVFELDNDSKNLLANHPTDIFLNDTDGIGDDLKSEAKVPELLDNLGLAHTGSDAKSLILTTDKVKTKAIFTQLGLQTPKDHGNLKYPLIVKPTKEDSSVGININSVVNNYSELQKATKEVLDDFGEQVLVEEYIDGRELNIAVLGNGDKTRTLPISEIIFGEYYKDKPKVIDFEAKWAQDSQEYKQTNGVCPADLPVNVVEELSKQSIAIFHACGGRDYGRVDVRLDKNNVPYFLEINLNPDIRPDTGIFRSAKAAGYDYPGFIKELIMIASLRYA